MRPLDPRYSALREQLDRYGNEYLALKARRRVGRGLILAAAVAAAFGVFLVGAWFGRANTIITFITL